MRVVLVNWAKIWDGASHGGGVNGYCQALAIALRRRGHDVISVCSGTTHLPGDRTCVVRRHEDWLGVRVFEIVNSPVLAPSITQFSRPLGEVSAPELETEFGRLMDLLRPDVVHFHNIEGFSIGCVDRARDLGARVVYSLHNYHTICPQVYLMQGHRRICTDAENGHACARCIDVRPWEEERARRAAQYVPAVKLRPRPTDELRAHAEELRGALSWVKRAAGAAVGIGASLGRLLVGGNREEPPPPPGYPARGPEDVSRLIPLKVLAPPGRDGAPPDDPRGSTREVLGELAPPRRPDPADTTDPERRPLLNLALPDPPSPRPPNEYGVRRAAMIAMPNRCDRVLAVSGFVRDKFVAMGVRPEVIEAQAIGTRINRVVSLAPELAFAPPPFERASPRPVRLVFMGYCHYYKGLDMLYESLEMLSPEQLRRIDLSIYALEGQMAEWLFRRLEPRLARLTYVPGYKFHDIPWICGGKDLGLVCSVWWDNAPQTVFEFLACGVPVLGAAVGGIPDFVHDGVNGLLFRGNDRADLARRLAEVVENPWLLERLRTGVRAPKDIDVNAAELEAVYLARGPASSPPPAPGANGVGLHSAPDPARASWGAGAPGPV